MGTIRPLLIAGAVALAARTVSAQTVVTTEAQLRAALTNTAVTQIVLGADITLTTGDLPSVSRSMTIDGGGHALSGNDQYRGLMVVQLQGGAATVAVAVAIQNLTITNTVATGGNGGSGNAGGGGGGGLGGGLYVASKADVTLSNVNFASNRAVGGNGGTAVVGVRAGGGGGLGGNGGNAGAGFGGGGGGAGSGANGGSNSVGAGGILSDGGTGGGVPLSGFAGGPQGGGGASSSNGAGGGGSAGATGASGAPGGTGGYGGGGGGGGQFGTDGGAGGVGGGGGGSGVNGIGGYGGGGGGNDRTAASANGGFGGGAGGGTTAAGGGGGAALGGGIFVEGGGTISIAGAVSVNGSTVTGGTAAAGGTNGSAFGAAAFFGGTGTVTFSSAAGETQRVAGDLADERGNGGAGQYVLNKTGAGTLILSGANSYAGGTTVAGGTLSVSSGANLGSGDLSLANATTLAVTATGAFGQNVNLGGAATVSVSGGQNATLNGIIGQAGSLNVNGGGTLTLTNAGNTYSGTAVNGNSTVVIGADGALGAAAGAVTLGDATSTGTLGVTNGSTVVSSRTFTIGAGGGVIDTAGKSTATLNTGLTGTGLFSKNGTGTLTLAGTSTQTGGTLVNDGVLRAGAVNAFGSGAVQVAAPAALDLNGFNQTVGSLSGAGSVALGAGKLDAGADNSSTLFSGVISGTGGLVKSGSGVMTLSGTNIYSGGTTVSGGTLAGTTTSLQGAILNDAAVLFNQNVAGTYAGAMDGSGSLTKSGTGVVTLSGANSYSGGTFVNGGALVGNTTSLQGNIVNGAVVEFNQAANGTYAGAMSGAGTLVKSGAGTLTLSGANGYSGGTTISAGTLAGDTNSLQGNIVDNAELLFNQGFNGTYAGNVTGTGALTKTGAGTVTLTGQADHTGGTLITGGTLAGTTLNLKGSIQDDAALMFNQSFDGTFNGIINGTGSLTKSGTGTVVFGGPQNYSGGTTVAGGTLVGDVTSLRGGILNNAQVVFDQAATGTYAGVMSGTGTLVKAGAGMLTLTGANTYSGGTLIASGTLAGDATTLQGAIVNNAQLVFNQNTNGLFTGGLSGSGSLTKNGAGTLTLAGPASYTGGTTITAGTLAGSSISIQGNVRNDAALLFAQNFGGTFTGAISGTGSLTKTGSGALVLNGINSYIGGTTVLGGALVGTTSSLQGGILNNAVVEFRQSLNGTYGGTMSGTGSLVKSGAGVLTLSGSNSYAGGTAIAGGAIAIAADAALGAAAGAVALGDALLPGTLTFTNAAQLLSSRAFTLGAAGGVFDTTGSTVTLSSGVSGAGGLTKTGQGLLELTGTGSYAGPTTVLAGTLRSGATNAFGSGNALVVGGGTTVDLNGFSQSVGSLTGSGSILLGPGTLTTGTDGTSGLFAGAITGAGSLVKTGGGTLFLAGANGYTGGTSVLGGALVGNTTSLQGDIFNNGLVQFDQGTNGTYAGSMTGSGALAKTGTGVLTLSGNNRYTGGTLINGGSVIGSAASLSGLIVNNAQLTFGGASDGIFGGTLTGGGSLTKTGTGTLTLNGTQSGSGLFTVAQGTLALNGSYGGSIDVAAGAALRANGIIGGSLNLAGTLFAVPPPAAAFGFGLTDATGAAIQGPSYLTIGRDLTAVGGSVLDFAIGPGATPTILVGGTAALNGARFNVTAPSIGTARSASFLALATVNGLSLNNTQVTSGDPGVIPILRRDRNSLFVTLLNLNVPLSRFAGPGTIAIAEAIDRTKFNAGGDGGLVVRELTALDDAGLQRALEQIGGQLHASMLQTAVLDSETVTELIRDQLSAREMEDGDDFRWWAETSCQHADFKATSTAHGGQSNVCAGAGGADRRFSERWTVGGGGSYSGGNMGLDANMGSGDYSSPRAFGYVGYKPKLFGFRGGGSAAKSNYQTERQIQFQATLPPELGGQPLDEGIDRKAESDQDGATKDAWSEIHDSRKVGSYTIEGLFGLRHARISRASFLETGAISLSLDGVEESLALTQTDVKVHAFRREGTFRPFFDFKYRRELAEGKTEANVKFTGLPNSEFIVEGINVPASSYHTRAGVTFATLVGQATFTYEFKKAPGQTRQTASLRFRFK